MRGVSWRVRLFLPIALLLAATPASAQTTLRLATIAPDGTAYARVVKAFAREVEAETKGAVRVKWVLGAIAGDEIEALERVRRGQLDGGAFALACGRLAPSVRVMRVPGLFQRRDEARHVLARLRSTAEQEMREHGFAFLGMAPFGSDIFFTRGPVSSFEDLRRHRLWVWDQDEVAHVLLPRMGFKVVGGSVESARKLYEDGKIEGYLALPSAALAYQWSSSVSYFMELPNAYLQACLVIANRAFDALPIEHQRAIRAAGGKASANFDQVTADQDQALVGGLFARHGLKRLEPSAVLRAAFFEAARRSRQGLDEKLVPKALLDRVYGWLADFRAEHQRP